MDEPDNAPDRQAITMPVHDEECQKLARLQQADDFFGPKYTETQSSKPPPGYEIKKGILRHEGKICLPNETEFLRDVLHDCHDSMGHFGVAKTLSAVRRAFYRPGLHAVVSEYCSACIQCKGSKKSRQRPIGEMHAQSNIRGSAFECIAIDVMMGLPMDDGNDACLVISDTFTKHVTLCPTSSSATATDIAGLLFNRLLNQGWTPSTIISDMDSKYISEVWNALMERLRIRMSVTSPYHQQADPAERSIQTIETILRAYNVGDEWTKETPFVERCINNATNTSTGYTPNELLFITPPAMKGMFDDSPGEEGEGAGAQEGHPDLLEQAKERLKAAKANIERAQLAQKRYYDRAHRPPDDIQAGDSVFLLLDLHPVRSLPRSKLAWPKWGPFKVIRRVSKTSVEVDFPRGIHKVVSVMHLEKLPEDRYRRQDDKRPAKLQADQLWEIDSIIGERKYGKSKYQQFRVRWSGRPIHDATWEFADDLAEDVPRKELNELVADFRRKRNGARNAAVNTAVESEERAQLGNTAAKRIKEGRTRERPILFLSRVLRSYERNYTILEHEMGAVVWAILKLQRYLDGVPFMVVTDHAPMIQVVDSGSFTPTSPRVERWRMLLEPFVGQMSFIHKPGKAHNNVNALMRLKRSGQADGGILRRQKSERGGES
jgi:hypothetical protein